MLKIAPLVLLVLASPAMADCVVRNPEVMYLGSNSNYDLTVEMVRSDHCLITFSSINPAIAFSSTDVVTQPKGSIAHAGTFNLAYTGADHGDTDLFRLKICGTDVKGSGCNVLTYHVTLHDQPK